MTIGKNWYLALTKSQFHATESSIPRWTRVYDKNTVVDENLSFKVVFVILLLMSNLPIKADIYQSEEEGYLFLYLKVHVTLTNNKKHNIKSDNADR